MYKLQFEPVPSGCWYQNLRSALPKEVWDSIRKTAYAKAQGKCMICGRSTQRLEAHERWSYDEERALQKLETVIAICRNCHEVIHVGRAYLMGRGNEVMEWFMKVNGCTQAEYHEELGKANEIHERRSKIDGWVTDISWLKDNLGK